MTREVSLALAQYGVEADDPPRSRRRSREMITAALDDGADVVILPELAIPGYTEDADHLAAGAETLDGPTVQEWTALAKASGSVVVGGICERGTEGLFNSAITVGPDGVLALYRKLHLFAGEKQIFLPGDQGLPVVDTPHGRIGVCVCYDLRFPEVARVMALRGAEIVASPHRVAARIRLAPVGRRGHVSSGPRRGAAGQPRPGRDRLRLCGRGPLGARVPRVVAGRRPRWHPCSRAASWN
ncbi:MAG: nitrilase-related carbon-nitrogen hydrolase [Acidimicrobiales bacterium]|nr:nitrilase-related carbon-nitrogen hydrolase [Acidimicrobiales bacterium]